MRWRPALAAGGVLLLCAAGIGAYVYSPTLALNDFLGAVRTKDRAGLERTVDFAALRQSSKDQFTAELGSLIATNPLTKNDPSVKVENYAGQITSAVNTAFTADELATELAASDTRSMKSDPASLFDIRFLSPTMVKAVPKRGPDGLEAYYLERHGLFSWRVVRLDFSKPLLDEMIGFKAELVRDR